MFKIFIINENIIIIIKLKNNENTIIYSIFLSGYKLLDNYQWLKYNMKIVKKINKKYLMN